MGFVPQPIIRSSVVEQRVEERMNYECPNCGKTLDSKLLQKRSVSSSFLEIVSPKAVLPCPRCGVGLEMNTHKLETWLPLLMNLAGLMAIALMIGLQIRTREWVLFLLLILLVSHLGGRWFTNRRLCDWPRFRRFAPESVSEIFIRQGFSVLIFIILLGMIIFAAAAIYHLA